MRGFSKFTATVICVIAVFQSSASYSDTVPSSREMRFAVASIDDNGLLVSTDGKRFRIYAVVLQSDFIQYATENILGKELHCNQAGQTGTRDMFIAEDTVASIDCSPMNSFIGNRSASLQQELIEAGVAVEYCQESRNYFKTCHTMQEQAAP